MSNPDPDLPHIRPRTALESARRYWENLRVLGEETGPPVPAEAHAELCRTAALMSIAESLDRLTDPPTVRTHARRAAQVAQALESLAKKLDKIEYHMR